MKRLIALLALVFHASLLMAADPAPIRKIIVVSDSLTNDDATNWLALAAKKRPGITWVGEAHGGWSTRSYFKEKFDGVAFARVPADADTLIVLIGSNNLFEAGGGSDEAVAEATAGVEKIVEHVRKLSPTLRTVLLVAPPTVALKNRVGEDPKAGRRVDDESPKYLEKLGRSYEALAKSKGWLFADLFPVLDENDFLDVSHPTPGGNEKVAATILSALDASH